MSENDPRSLISHITKIAELEKERDDLRLSAKTLEMKLGIAEKKLSDIDECLAPHSPPKVGETIAIRVKRLLEQLEETTEKLATLTNARRSQDERQALWEQVAKLVSGNVNLALVDAAAKASATAAYCDQLLAEGEQRFSKLTSPGGT